MAEPPTMHPIGRLLVANRGEIATRIMRTARDLGMTTVAVYADADADLPYVGEADVAVRLPGVTAAETYLRADVLVDAARHTGADAVHPGYGFLSERAELAEACAAAGITFIGPPATVIERMGSKLAARDVMAAAGVPVLPGAPVDADADAGVLARAADSVGYPLVVKAVFGGGGRGMRVVEHPAELADAVVAAAREAAAAFGDGAVFLERWVNRPRHVEIQVVGDAHGAVVALYERECSIQRRHQKVIEEAPSPGVDAARREAMGAAAVHAAEAIGYVSAGTVEFVLDASGDFWFVEMNTRLQVEHAVTEMVTDVDLVALQLQIAGGEPLPTAIHGVEMHGHAIEARIYAEDVSAGSLPVSGRLLRCSVPDAVGVRVDSGYADGTTVSPYYDAMLAKVVAWGATREQARARLTRALRRARVHGVATNIDLLVGILEHPEFRAGAIDTAFLDRHAPASLIAPPDVDIVARMVTIAALTADAAARDASPLPVGIPRAWRNVGPWSQPRWFDVAGRRIAVDAVVRPGAGSVAIDGVEEPVVVHACSATSADVEMRGVRTVATVGRDGPRVFVAADSVSLAMTEEPRFPLPAVDEAPGSLVAPMPGAVIAVAAGVGDVVGPGAPLVVLEAMKMEHVVRAPVAGIVAEIRVEVGQQVDAGDVLVVLSDVGEDGADGP